MGHNGGDPDPSAQGAQRWLRPSKRLAKGLVRREPKESSEGDRQGASSPFISATPRWGRRVACSGTKYWMAMYRLHPL